MRMWGRGRWFYGRRKPGKFLCGPAASVLGVVQKKPQHDWAPNAHTTTESFRSDFHAQMHLHPCNKFTLTYSEAILIHYGPSNWQQSYLIDDGRTLRDRRLSWIFKNRKHPITSRRRRYRWIVLLWRISHQCEGAIDDKNIF